MILRTDSNLPFLSGWSRRKKITFNATYEDRGRILNITVFNTSGTDTAATVYLGGNVRSDWGDIRITKEDAQTLIPYAILRTDATSIVIAIPLVVKNGDRQYYIYYDGPAADVFKIGRTTDQHYDPNGAGGSSSEHDRVNTITKLTAFNTRMGLWTPDLILHGGDHAGAQSAVEATQLAWMTSVMDECHNGPVGIPVRIVSPGNHDFEYVSLANFRALLDDYESWLETSVCYGTCFENDDYIILSMDSNDTVASHESISHKGNGYIGSAQLLWLKAQLDAADKPVIIDIHHPCCEMDTDQFTLTKEIYHTADRIDFRDIVNQSRKVIAVLHGHMHFTRTDVVKGVPYIVCTNLTDDGSFGEVPLSTSGKWCEIEFDKSNLNINVKHVALISGTYHTVYEFNLPFGKTTYHTDIANNPEEVFKYYEFGPKYGAGYGKSSFLRDATQLYVIDDANLYKFPVNLHTPDNSPLFKEAIKIEGRNDDPNFGRAMWVYENCDTQFIFEGWVMLGQTDKIFALKFGLTPTTFPKVYISFEDGNINREHFSGGVPSEDILQAYSANTWYRIEIHIDAEAGGFTMTINDVGYGPFGVYVPSFNNKFRQLEILTETGDFWIHGFNTRPWNPPRPTITGFSIEQTV